MEKRYLGINFTPEQMIAIRREAQRRGNCSLAAVLRELVQNHLVDKQEGPRDG